jgi:hypothetical protein
MAHFAKIDENNIVTEVQVVNNLDIGESQGGESETKGIEFLRKINGENTNWVQTSYNTYRNIHELGGEAFRWNYATIGSTWDPAQQGFILPKPFNSWVWNDTQKDWDPPTGFPPEGTGIIAVWNEELLRWDKWDELSQTWSEYTW